MANFASFDVPIPKNLKTFRPANEPDRIIDGSSLRWIQTYAGAANHAGLPPLCDVHRCSNRAHSLWADSENKSYDFCLDHEPSTVQPGYVSPGARKLATVTPISGEQPSAARGKMRAHRGGAHA